MRIGQFWHVREWITFNLCLQPAIIHRTTHPVRLGNILRGLRQVTAQHLQVGMSIKICKLIIYISCRFPVRSLTTFSVSLDCGYVELHAQACDL